MTLHYKFIKVFFYHSLIVCVTHKETEEKGKNKSVAEVLLYKDWLRFLHAYPTLKSLFRARKAPGYLNQKTTCRSHLVISEAQRSVFKQKPIACATTTCQVRFIVSSFTLLLRCLLLLLLLHSKPSNRQKHLGYAIIITIQQHMYRANRWAMRLLCCIMVLCCRVCISIPMNGRVAGVLCSGALPLSDKTMTQYDEKQRWLSAIVFTKKR